MTVHVSVRSIFALLLLCVSLWGLPADALAQSVAPPKTAPTLAERLNRLAAEFDRNRIDLHVPGAVLAIVRGEEVIFARGFGVADIDKKTPVTPDTPFSIGSVTKAFTATLVGMLVDEGRMRWDDPVETYLPEFKLKVQSKDPNDRATIRDVLSHRTGFSRMSYLEANTGLSSDEILRRAPSAEAFAPFRQRFLYNNVQYLAAGSAAAVAAGTSWDALMKARILAPLGMASTRTSLREAWKDPRTARGYWWDEAGQRIRSPTGAVSALNVHRPSAVPPVLRLTPIASLPTVDEIMTLRRIASAPPIATMRVTGTVRFPQSAVDGRFSSSSAGDDRLRLDLDLDQSLQIRTVLNNGRASQAMNFAPPRELTGKQLAQMRLGHRSVLFGDWRKYYDAVRVVRTGEFGGRRVHGIQLESAGLPPVLVAVDAETGDVLQTQQTLWAGESGALPTTTTYSDYREVGGLRVPHRYIESAEFLGRAIYQVERVEVGVELAPDTFTLQAPTASGQGK